MKNIEMVMFDLDGTLLPMDMDVFTSGYFRMLAEKVRPYGYEEKQMIRTIWQGVAAMVRNDGSCTNEEAFWREFCSVYGEEKRADIPVFNEFYAVEFNRARDLCGYNPRAAQVVKKLQAAGIRTGLATNPLFPATATENRIRWAGLEPENFEFYTTYENICYCKPNPEYYKEVLRRVGLPPQNCLMVGNDAEEDMIAARTGMQVFLLTDCLINKKEKDISCYPHGGFDELERVLFE